MVTKMHKKIIILLSFCNLLFSSGTTTFEFLKINTDPYITSIGEGGFALEGFNFNNPASFSFLNKNLVSFSYFSWLIDDIKSYNISGSYLPPFGGIISGLFKYFDYKIDYYSNTYQKLSLASSNEFLLEVFYSDKIKKVVPIEKIYGSWGVGVKLLSSNLAGYSAQSFALDLGLLYKLSSIGLKDGGFINNFSLGFSIQDLGLNAKYIKKENNLPTRYSIGLCYNDIERLMVFFDSTFSQYSSPIYSVGITITPVYPIKTSIGWKINENSLVNGLRAGFSIEVKDIIFEYGFTNTSEFAKPVHKIAVKYLFSTQPVYKTYKEYAIKQLIVAKEYFLRGEYTVAKNIVEDILKIYPEYPDAVLLKERIENELTGITTAKQNYVEKIVKRINESIQKNNLFEAKRYYNILLEIDRYNPLIPHIEEEIKNLEKSFQEEKIKKQYSKKIEKLYKEAVEYSDKKEYEKAKEKFKEILKIYPEHKQAQEYISKIDSYLAEIEAQKIEEEVKKAKQLYEEGKYTQALDMFQSLKTKLPQRVDLDEYIENCKRKIEETKVKTPQVPKFAPKRKDLEDKFNEAMKLYDNKEYEKSIVVFKEVIKLSEKYKDEEKKRQAQNYIILANEFIAKNYYDKGLKKEQEGDLETSYELYKKSLESNPNNPSLKQKFEDIAKTLSEKYYNEGLKFFLQNDSQKAKENFQKSLYYYENENARKALERIK